MIKANSLTKFYKKTVPALDKFSYVFEEGKITGLIGLNGAGKSTLLKILSLQLYPTSGNLEINGETIDTQTESERKIAQIKSRIGFVSENAQFNGDLKVSELLKSTCEFYEDNSCRAKNARADDINAGDISAPTTSKQCAATLAKLCALEDVLDKKIKTLSKGYRQRLSFALALANDPEILILDEPISGLDPVQINEIRNLIKSLKKSRTIILSTHIMQEVSALCDNIVILHDGKIVISGTEQDILEATGKDDIEAAFLALQAGGGDGSCAHHNAYGNIAAQYEGTQNGGGDR
ncbi:MAG: ABC transporter ATP-binding protein [Treponemataceae bacterium]|nr:ABC transporter ATP-binding protein [Treponemataceae bacterium]